jgi:hypothetical protein
VLQFENEALAGRIMFEAEMPIRSRVLPAFDRSLAGILGTL